MVKCAQCGAGWAPVVAVLRTSPLKVKLTPEPVLPNPVPDPELVVRPILKAVSPPVASPAPSASLIVLGAWVASIALLALVAVAAYAWRTEVMQAWPESERAYALLGLAAR